MLPLLHCQCSSPVNLIRENSISNVYSILTSCSWAFGLLHYSRLQLWRDLTVFWSCSFSLCWTHAESKLDTVVRTEAFSGLFFVQWVTDFYFFSSDTERKCAVLSNWNSKDVQMLMNKNANAFILDHFLNLPFDPLYQNTPNIVHLPICNILNMPFFVTVHRFNSIISYIFVRCVYTYDMPRLHSLLTCTNIYYYCCCCCYLILKTASLFCFS